MNSSECLFTTVLLTAAWPASVVAQPDLPSQLASPANTWVKRAPLPSTPVSPRLGYEGACVWDSQRRPYRFGVFVYRIRAVNAAGAESGPSPPFFTIPSAPQWLFSKEDGATCHLQWAANSEKALKGYRVYRMKGRYDKDPIPRLTSDPVPAITYSDTTAGKSSRRYYVVAVDTLGQEGFPSAPVWFEREWKQYYKPLFGHSMVLRLLGTFETHIIPRSHSPKNPC